MPQPTPMLQQYQQIKSRHKDCILFFRLGDFYEMFYDDAREASGLLDLVLTSRGKGTANHVPMCGVPYHAAENYIARLIKSGKKVAICEQVEDPAAAKGLVRRDVTRVITSGTYLDETSTDARYLFCVHPKINAAKNIEALGIAFIDPASGTIQVNQYKNFYPALELMARLPVYECVYPDSAADALKDFLHHPFIKIKKTCLSRHEDWCFNPDIAKKTLCEHFSTANLRGFGVEELDLAVGAAGALLEYLRQMNKTDLKHIDRISLFTESEFVYISPAAVFGLELENFFKSVNHTLCPLGKRKLRDWVYHPLKTPAAILQRQAAVTLLKEQPDPQKKLKDLLSQMPDVEKSISKLSCGYTSPRDLLAIRNALCLIPELADAVRALAAKNRLFTIDDIPELRELLEKAVNPEMPLTNNEGKTIRPGFHQELDGLRDIQKNGREWLARYQADEIKRTGISTLKAGFNKIFGYYIEISKAKAGSVPADYIRKQTLVNGERFITPALKEFEEKILTAQEKIVRIENTILDELKKTVLNHSAQLHAFCQSAATLDAIYSLTTLAQRPGYAAPEIADDTLIDIRDGRHPVVERAVIENFVPNDSLLDCDENHLIILTGPNMAGKSTYIRQTALLVILAQTGSYIPAKKAHIGIVDKIFTRIGAHDDITRGQSTFMVEMTETADILNNLTDRSLVILDEIGRGTSTYDGLSLAWAIAEHLKNTRARTLFATHFHELTALAGGDSGIKNYNVAVKEWQDTIIFLHKIVAGGTDDSYGIYVAKLAGVPSAVINRARQVLTELELAMNLKEKFGQKVPERRSAGTPGTEQQLGLFSGEDRSTMDPLRKTLEEIDINRLTPLQALEKLQELKGIADKSCMP